MATPPRPTSASRGRLGAIRPDKIPTSARGPTSTADRDGFRPDLEGLRAVAVLLVLFYHAQVPGFGGGFVGVDVFFVLSGFLITGLLLRELGRSGTISLSAFYARRARRLLPAAFLILSVTLVAALLVLPPLQVGDVGGDIAAAALYVSNMRFGLQATDYLQAAQAPSPVLHYWSLGVEEQFYVFWPAIVLLVGRGAGRFGRRVGRTAIAISIASLVLAVWLTGVDEPWAFFSLPPRAWELGLGAMLAVGAGRLGAIPGRLATTLGWVGLGLVVLSGIVISAQTPFPGTAALLPTIGSALVILAGFRVGAWGAGHLLGTPLPRFFGRISYSLYLWHWPLLLLPAAAIGHPLRWWERGSMVLLAFPLAALTQRWVENPLRHGRIVGILPGRNLVLAGTLSLVVALASVGVGTMAVAGLGGANGNAAADEANLHGILGPAASAAGAGSPTPGGPSPSPVAPSPSPTPPATADRPVPSDLLPSLATARHDVPLPALQGCDVDIGGTLSPACLYGDPHGASTVVLFGDSHALTWFPAVDRVARANGWRLINLTKSGCGSADVVQWSDALGRAYTECSQWRTNSFTRIARERPALVILTNSRAIAILTGGRVLRGDDALAPWQAGIEHTMARIAAVGDPKIAIIGDMPRSAFDVPVCLSKHRDSILACATAYPSAVSPTWVAAGAAAAAAGRATFIDPIPWICPSWPCPPVISNFLVFRDRQHLATPFSAALADYLRAVLPKLGP